MHLVLANQLSTLMEVLQRITSTSTRPASLISFGEQLPGLWIALFGVCLPFVPQSHFFDRPLRFRRETGTSATSVIVHCSIGELHSIGLFVHSAELNSALFLMGQSVIYLPAAFWLIDCVLGVMFADFWFLSLKRLARRFQLYFWFDGTVVHILAHSREMLAKSSCGRMDNNCWRFSLLQRPYDVNRDLPLSLRFVFFGTTWLTWPLTFFPFCDVFFLVGFSVMNGSSVVPFGSTVTAIGNTKRSVEKSSARSTKNMKVWF